jgi:ribosomal protein S18 acetylase RimI-like enzyme
MPRFWYGAPPELPVRTKGTAIGVTARPAQPEDALQIAMIHVYAWQSAYRGIVPDEYLDSLSIEQRASGWRQILSRSPEDVWVALENDEVLGWISAAASRDSDAGPATGEIWAIYVAPEHWRTGIGRMLCEGAEQRLGKQGMDEVTLWVLRDNQRALRFYQSHGFSIDPGIEKTEGKTGAKLIEVRMRKRLGLRTEKRT